MDTDMGGNIKESTLRRVFPAQVFETKQAELIEFHPNARGFCLIIILDSESSSAPNGLPPNLLLSLESLVLVSFFLHPLPSLLSPSSTFN